MLNEKEHNEYLYLERKGLNGNQTEAQALRYFELKELKNKDDNIKKTWSIYDKKEKSYE